MCNIVIESNNGIEPLCIAIIMRLILPPIMTKLVKSVINYNTLRTHNTSVLNINYTEQNSDRGK